MKNASCDRPRCRAGEEEPASSAGRRGRACRSLPVRRTRPREARRAWTVPFRHLRESNPVLGRQGSLWRKRLADLMFRIDVAILSLPSPQILPGLVQEPGLGAARASARAPREGAGRPLGSARRADRGGQDAGGIPAEPRGAGRARPAPCRQGRNGAASTPSISRP